MEDNDGPGKSADAARVRFVNCSLKNVFTRNVDPVKPIHIRFQGENRIARHGGIDFRPGL